MPEQWKEAPVWIKLPDAVLRGRAGIQHAKEARQIVELSHLRTTEASKACPSQPNQERRI